MSKSKRPASSGGTGLAIAQGKRGSERRKVDGVFQPNAGGIDIGAREIYVAVPPDRDQHPVRKCGTFTGDLDQMAEWVVSCGIATVAMESTGVYWIPVYEAVERHGIEACLVNPRNMLCRRGRGCRRTAPQMRHLPCLCKSEKRQQTRSSRTILKPSRFPSTVSATFFWSKKVCATR